MKRILLLFAFVFLFSSISPAWDDTGHKITAYIAWQQMGPQAREKAFKTLMAAPEDSDLSVFYLQGSRSEESKRLELFMIASTWADIIRDRDFKERYKKYHKGNWHYFDYFWKTINGKVEILEDADSNGKALEKLNEFEIELRDPSKKDSEKAIGLAWILHLAGDIHQPLHCSARITADEPKGDQGGNLFLLTPKDGPRENSENIHWYWDSIIGRNIPRENDACDSDYVLMLAKKIMKKHPLSKMGERAKLMKYEDWHKEGFELAAKEVYGNGLARNEMPSPAYKKMAFRISQERIALAGYRMGALLNDIFGK